MNNFIKILTHLKKYEGDGIFHDIEHLLPDLSKEQIKSILKILIKDELIKVNGGTFSDNGYAINSYFGFENSGGEKFRYIPYKGLITTKGIEYLNRYNKEQVDVFKSISIGDNATANIIINSKGATINNNIEIIETINKIMEKIYSDNTIEQNLKDTYINDFNTLKNEIINGVQPSNSIEKILTIGSNISSIGSLVVSLIQLFASKS